MVEIIAKNNGVVKNTITCEGAVVIAANDGENNTYRTDGYCIGGLSFPSIINSYMACAIAQVEDVVSDGHVSKLQGVEVLHEALKKFLSGVESLFDKWDENLTEDDQKELDKAYDEILQTAHTPLGYADESEHDDFDDETENADFTS